MDDDSLWMTILRTAKITQHLFEVILLGVLYASNRCNLHNTYEVDSNNISIL